MEFKSYDIKILPAIQRFSKRLSHTSNILYYRWYLYDEDRTKQRMTVAFGPDNEFIYVADSIRDIGYWKNPGNELLYIETSEKSVLFKCAFLSDRFLICERIFQNGYIIFYKENMFSNLGSPDEINEYLLEAHIGSLVYELRCEDEFFISKTDNLSLSNSEEFLLEALKQKLSYGELIVKNTKSGAMEVIDWKKYFKIKVSDNADSITLLYFE